MLRTLLFIVSACLIVAISQKPVLAAGESLEKGIVEYQHENFEEALSLLKLARTEYPGSSIAAFYLGLAYKQTGDYHASADQFRAAIQLNPPVIDALLELADVLYTLGDLPGAMLSLEDAERRQLKPQAVAFLKGLVLAAQGENDKARTAFDRAKELDPSLAQAVELQNVVLLAKERRIKKARDSLKALIAIDPTSEIASLSKEYEHSFNRIISSHKTFRGSVGISYQYDDNVVSRPSTDISGLEISGEEDHAFVGSLRLEYAPLLDGPLGIVAQYSLLNTTYGSNDTHNSILQSFSLLPTYSFSNASISVPLSYTHYLLKEENYMGMTSIRPTLSYILDIGHIAQLNIGYTYRDMLQAPLSADEDRDSDIFNIGAGYFIPFADARGMASFRYEFTYDNAVGANWGNLGHRLSLGVTAPLIKRISANLNSDIFFQDYFNVHSTFVVQRNDTIYNASCGLTWEVVAGLSINMQYAFTRAQSNIASYDYQRNTFTTGVEYAF